jgi:hypothetical protein
MIPCCRATSVYDRATTTVAGRKPLRAMIGKFVGVVRPATLNATPAVSVHLAISTPVAVVRAAATRSFVERDLGCDLGLSEPPGSRRVGGAAALGSWTCASSVHLAIEKIDFVSELGTLCRVLFGHRVSERIVCVVVVRVTSLYVVVVVPLETWNLAVSGPEASETPARAEVQENREPISPGELVNGTPLCVVRQAISKLSHAGRPSRGTGPGPPPQTPMDVFSVRPEIENFYVFLQEVTGTVCVQIWMHMFHHFSVPLEKSPCVSA